MQRALCLTFALLVLACAPEDPPPSEADEIGVGAQCAGDADCNPEDYDSDGMQDQQCLTNFKGGYCGLQDCLGDSDCPQGSACVTHDDNVNYCFRICRHKDECNYNRSPDVESNCSSNITLVNGGGVKACVPPSG